MKTNSLKARLKAGETITGAWIDSGSETVAEMMVHAGWDVLVIDCEHGAAGLEDGLKMLPAVEAAGGHAVVRVPDQSEATLKRALDRGATSILVPMVHSTTLAADIARFCRYAPGGLRGYAAPIVRASGYGAVSDYAARANDELLLMVQIEHIAAVGEVAAMAAVPGIDMVFIGPNDLACSMGHIEQTDHPDVLAELARIEAAARQAGLMLGTIVGGGRDWAALRAKGFGFIVGPNDVALLMTAAREARRAAQASLAG